MDINKKILIPLIIIIVIAIIVVFFISTSGFNKEKFTISNEKYTIKFSVPDNWSLGSDTMFDDPKNSYIKGFVNENGAVYFTAIENLNVLTMNINKLLYNGKEDFIKNGLGYSTRTAHELLTNGLEEKKINNYEVYYYIDGDEIEWSDPMLGIHAYIFIDNDYYININSRLLKSNGYTTDDLEKCLSYIVKSLKISNNT